MVITATSAVGIVDPTPATVKFKVQSEVTMARALSDGTTNRSTIARSSAASRPGAISSETIDPDHPARGQRVGDHAAAERLDHRRRLRELGGGGGVPAREPRRQGSGTRATRRSAESTAVTSRSSGSRTRAASAATRAADAPGLAVDVGHVQLVAVREVAVEGGARAARGAGDVAHRDRADAVLGEQLAGGVEDLLGGHPGAVLAQPGHRARPAGR